jgi:hypothetical protein
MKVQKYPCFVSFKVKDVIALYIKIQKPQNTFIQQHNNFLTLGQIHIFTIKTLMQSQESSWSTSLYFVDFRGKNIFLLCKK